MMSAFLLSTGIMGSSHLEPPEKVVTIVEANVDSENSEDDIRQEFIPPVSQGDAVNIGNLRCTIGFVNKDYIITSAHCNKDGVGAHAYQHGVHIGTVVAQPNLANEDYGWINNVSHDWTVIKLNDNIYAGGNVYSKGNNAHISFDDVAIGDTVCSYGYTSKKVSCGRVEDKRHQVLYTDDTSKQSGDSGGPMWIPGKGFVGLYYGTTKGGTHSISVPLKNRVPYNFLVGEL